MARDGKELAGDYTSPDTIGYAYHDPYDNPDYNDNASAGSGGGGGGGGTGSFTGGLQSAIAAGLFGGDTSWMNDNYDTPPPVEAAPPPVSSTDPAQGAIPPATPTHMDNGMWGPDGRMAADPMDTQKQDAFAYLKQLFESYGLGSLSGRIQQYVQDGYTGDTISLMLAETPEYKTRFAGNDARQKKNLPRLTPRDYLAMEQEYTNLFRQYGLPDGMYDQSDDFVTYIGNDVSPQEMDSRLQIAKQTVRSDSATVRDTYKQWYASGLTEGDAIAAVLDPGRALPELERKQRASAAGGAATFYGLQANQGRSEYLADQGVSQDEAFKGYQQVQSIFADTKGIADMYGGDYTQTDAENEAFFGTNEAQKKRQDLNKREMADFSGGQKANSRSFGTARY